MRLAALLLVAAGCAPDIVYPSSGEGECGAGSCEAPGYCAFADTGCASGLRFGELAPEGVASRCVGESTPLPDAAPTQTEVTITEVTDTWLDSSSPTQNHGGGAVLRVDGDPARHALLRFDLLLVPAGKTVVAAELRVYTAGSEGGFGNEGVIELYPATEAWDEGSVDGQDGAASWNERKPATAWSGPGASGASRGATRSAAIPARADSTQYTVSIPVEVVQGWVDDPGSNFGVVMTCPVNEDVTFFTRGAGSSSQRPRLTVSFVP